MTRRRFALTCVVAFLPSQVFAVLIHGYVLAADYEPFRGNLLCSMDGGAGWQALSLPVAHLSFVVAFVWTFARVRLSGTWMRQDSHSDSLRG